MKLAIVRPREKIINVVDVRDVDDAKVLAGLDRDQTDNGTLYMGLGYICHEHAMFVHPQFYFAIGHTLMAGSVVLYAFDALGRTVDYNLPAHLWGGTFIGDEKAAEAAIRAGKVDRPRLAMGDDVHWQWPAPMPDMEAWARKLAAALMKGPVQVDDITIMEIPNEEEKK
jgi:hypothetical protein